MINIVLSILHEPASLSDSSVVLFGRHVRVKVMFGEVLYLEFADFARHNTVMI